MLLGTRCLCRPSCRHLCSNTEKYVYHCLWLQMNVRNVRKMQPFFFLCFTSPDWFLSHLKIFWVKHRKATTKSFYLDTALMAESKPTFSKCPWNAFHMVWGCCQKQVFITIRAGGFYNLFVYWRRCELLNLLVCFMNTCLISVAQKSETYSQLWKQLCVCGCESESIEMTVLGSTTGNKWNLVVQTAR